jgi:uncharacterized protein
MRVVTLEEHYSAPQIVKRIDPTVISRRGFRPRKAPPAGHVNPLDLLPEIGQARLKSMDDTGITVQVLSPSGPGPELLTGAEGAVLARELNDHLATAIANEPRRFAGFAGLPMANPAACGPELKRSVKELGFHGALINGTTDGRFLDHPSYEELLAAASELDVPLYIHPSLPPAAVHEAYYSGLPGGTERTLACPAWGWHSEVAIHVLRMVFAGTLDKHRSGSRPAASSPSPRSSLHCKPSALIASCSRSTIHIHTTSRAARSSISARCRQSTWPSSPTAMLMPCCG